MLLIGDIHKKTDKYMDILNKYPAESSIQVGDFGFSDAHNFALSNIDTTKHKILFGNHDDYSFLYEKHSLGDYGVKEIVLKTGETKTLFWYRGANSIDKKVRNINIDYWENEEIRDTLTIEKAISLYEYHKPDIVVSHDCPKYIKVEMFNIFDDKSITGLTLNKLFDIHKPEKWYFGHHHRNKTVNYLGTEFNCIGEFEYITI